MPARRKRTYADFKRGQLDWVQTNELVSALGSEQTLAARVQAERVARGWSQSELSRQLSAIGHPMHQTAISKIEKPPPTGRRAINVDEAIGFSKLFEIPLPELLLPPDSLHDGIEMLRDLAEGRGAVGKVADASNAYRNLVYATVRRRLREPVRWEAALRERLAEIDARLLARQTAFRAFGKDISAEQYRAAVAEFPVDTQDEREAAFLHDVLNLEEFIVNRVARNRAGPLDRDKIDWDSTAKSRLVDRARYDWNHEDGSWEGLRTI